jgi:hypothetical protein
MKMNSGILVLLVSSLFNFTACSTTKDCTGDCSNKMVPDSVQPDKKVAIDLKSDVARPLALAMKGALVITKNETARVPAGNAIGEIPQSDYQVRFCLQFSNIEWQVITTMLDDMQATPYPVDDYFKISACQPEGYSNVVKSPLAHVIADDPSKRIKFLDILWLYYSKKRKDPSKFVEMVNAKNTEGETLLDYLESMRLKGKYTIDGSKASVAQIISVACSHGALYSAFPDKKCPQ